MQLALAPQCPIFAHDNRRHLTRLLELVAKGWHTIVRPRPTELETMLPPEMWMTFGKFLRDRYRTVTTSRESRFAPPLCETCNAGSLVEYLELTVQVIVENATTDGSFLRLIGLLFDPSLARGLKVRRIDIRTAGGVGEIPKEMRRLIGERSAAVLPGASPLIFALADSDADAPGRQSSAARAVLATAAELGCRAHVLAKRTIENYVTDDALLEYVRLRADRRPAAEYIISLSSTVRDHYPMKHGLHEPPIDHPIFPDSIRLGVGLGDFMADLMATCSHHIDRRGLGVRDQGNELALISGSLAGCL